MPDVLTPAEYRALTAKPSKPTNRQKPASTSPKAPAAPTAAGPPAVAQSAQNAATLGVPACQVWKGASGQGSVVRFFGLTVADRTALLEFAASRGIHPVNR